MTTRLALVLFILLFSAVSVLAQETSAAQNVEDLKSELAELQNTETSLRNRLDQLEYDLRPENIERFFSGTGSTRPEELREQRRRQLQSEKDRINNQLNDLSTRRVRLESAIAEAEAKAYQQSALGQAALQRERNEPHFSTAARLAIGISVAVLVLGAIILLFIMKRRQSEL